jgi:hypothetical protein
MADTLLVEYDPLHPVYAHFGPKLTKRLLEFSEENFDEGEPRLFVQQMLARLTAGDPSIRLLVAVNPDTAEVVGHCLATMERHGGKAWVFVWQCKLDGKTEAGHEMLAHLKHWGRDSGATNLIMCTHRSERAWEKKYGFTSKRVLMTQPIEVV